MAQLVMVSVQVCGVWRAKLLARAAAPIIRLTARISPAVSIRMIQAVSALIRKLIRVRAT